MAKRDGVHSISKPTDDTEDLREDTDCGRLTGDRYGTVRDDDRGDNGISPKLDGPSAVSRNPDMGLGVLGAHGCSSGVCARVIGERLA
jgi:hypothetical protein